LYSSAGAFASADVGCTGVDCVSREGFCGRADPWDAPAPALVGAATAAGETSGFFGESDCWGMPSLGTGVPFARTPAPPPVAAAAALEVDDCAGEWVLSCTFFAGEPDKLAGDIATGAAAFKFATFPLFGALSPIKAYAASVFMLTSTEEDDLVDSFSSPDGPPCATLAGSFASGLAVFTGFCFISTLA